VTGNELNHLAMLIAKGCSDFPNALKQGVVAGVGVWPDGIQQFMLAQDPPWVGGKQNQQAKRFRPQFKDFAIGPTQFGARPIQLKPRETQHHCPTGSPP
jgi:hypothetical protein